MLLLHVMTAVQYPATGTDRCLPVTGRCFGPQPAWLLPTLSGVFSRVKTLQARLIFGLRRSEHNGPASQSSLVSRPREHPLQSRRTYYLLAEQWMTVLQCTCRPTSTELLTCCLDWDSDHWPLTNWLFQLTTSLVSAEGPFQFGLPFSGTVTLHISHQHRSSRFSASVFDFFSSGAPMLTSDTPSLHSAVDLAVLF